MLNSPHDVYQDNKLERITGAVVVTDRDLAVALLKSDAFSVVNLKDYLRRLEAGSGYSFKHIIDFISFSPFFNEGEIHQQLKKHIGCVFSKANLTRWQPRFEQQIAALNDTLQTGDEIDLVAYSFAIAKRLLRPLILGFEDNLPDDFEARLYHFQKIAEPLLPIRELIALEAELAYLFTRLDLAVRHNHCPIEHSFPALADSALSHTLTQTNSMMLLIVVYGAKSPLIQTLANIFLTLLSRAQHSSGDLSHLDEPYIAAQLDTLINQSASLLHIHRVANRAFTHGDFCVNAGDYVLIRTRSNVCRAHKGLGFGLTTHYCSGALLAKHVLSLVIPAFFQRFPNVRLTTYAEDPTLHTAQALTELKVVLS